MACMTDKDRHWVQARAMMLIKLGKACNGKEKRTEGKHGKFVNDMELQRCLVVKISLHSIACVTEVRVGVQSK